MYQHELTDADKYLGQSLTENDCNLKYPIYE